MALPVNLCVLPILIATLLQLLTGLKKNRLPEDRGGASEFWQHVLMLGTFASFLSKIRCFCGLDRARTCDLIDMNRSF